MSTLKAEWEKIHHRLVNLTRCDQEEEAELLEEAYERLISAYQESRELNDEMEILLQEALAN